MKTIKYLIGAITLSVSIYSCRVYKSYKRPETISTENLFRTDNMQTAIDTSQNMAHLYWQEIFTDSLLQKYIEKGLKNNTDLRIAQLRIEQSEILFKNAKFLYLPSFSLTPNIGVNKIEGQRRTLTHRETLAASWELDVFGKIRNSNQQKKIQLEKSIAYQQAVRSGLIASIATNYYSLAAFHQQLNVMELTLTNWTENVRVLRAMKNAGMTTEAAVSQAEGNYYLVEASVVEIKQQIAELENSFSSILEETAKTIDVNVNSISSFIPTQISIGIPMQLLVNRPDVRQAESDLKEAFYGVNVTQASFYPSITLRGNAGWSNSVGNAIVNPAQFIASAVGSLVQPLFNQGRLTSQLKIAKSQQEEASLTYQQTLFDAGVEINNALSAIQTSRIKNESYNKQIASLQNAVKSTKLLMQHSSNTYLEVLTSQQTLLDAELNQIENEFEEAQNIIVLYRALGGGSI